MNNGIDPPAQPSPSSPGGWFSSNAAALDPIYPQLARRLRSCMPAPPPASFETGEALRLSFETAWSGEVELHVLDGFVDSPLTWFLFERIQEAELLDDRNRRLLLVDDRLDLFRWVLDQRDWRILIKSDRCLFALDDDRAAALQKLLSRYPEISQARFFVHPGSPGRLDTPSRSLQEILDSMKVRVQTRLRDYARDYAAKKQIVFPRHVRFLVAGHNYLQDACVRTLCEMGYLAGRLQWKNPLYRFVRSTAWIHAHREQQLDTAFFINSTPRLFTDAALFASLPLHSIAWFVDHPRRFERNDEDAFSGCDVVGVFDRTYIPYLQSRTAAPVMEVRTAFGVDPALAHPDEAFASIPIAFVGELGANGFLALEQGYRKCRPHWIAWADALLASLDLHRPIDLHEAVSRAGNALDAPYRGHLVAYLENKATYLRRRHFLEPLVDFGLRVFGDAEWGDPALAGPLARCYAGRRVDYASELPRLYASVPININVFHVQCVHAPNPRVYDVLASGGFLLTSYNPGLEDEFVIGEDLDVFHSRDELLEKVRYYLAHPVERRAIAENGKRRVLALGGCHDRMQIFLSTLTQAKAGGRYVYLCR